MVNFAELKAKAEKAKDASVTKMANTRDRFSSASTSKSNWDPNWKRAPPQPATASSARTSTGPPRVPLRSRPDIDASGSSVGVGAAPPAIPVASRPTDDAPAPPAFSPRPPPTRAPSGYPPSVHRRDTPDAVDRIDWANLSAEDKEAFFGWLDEFFARYLQIELGPRRAGVASSAAATLPVRRAQYAGPPPSVNLQTRPPV